MAEATPHLSASDPNRRQPIGEVHMLVYDWRRGQSEVHMRLPDEAMDGAPDAATHRGRVQHLVNDELNALFSMLASSPFGQGWEAADRPPET